jgi:diguanylate cyclase
MIAGDPGFRGSERSYCAVIAVQQFDDARATLGYRAAESLMSTWASRIETVVIGGRLGRVGRNSIEIAYEACSDEHARDILIAALTCFERAVDHGGMRLRFGAAAGFTPLGEQSFDDAAIDRATAAAAAASRRPDRLSFQPLDAATDTSDDLAVAQAIYAAIEFDELQSRYQPKLHCRKDTIAAVEALTRFPSDALSGVSVDRAFLIAERIGAIEALTDWLVERVIADRVLLADAGHAPAIDINLSGRLLSDRRYADRLARRLTGRGIGIEITETAVLSDPAEAIRSVNLLAEAGIHIAIDDYGSGFSSLAYLKDLPARELKIDRMFIKGLTTSHRDPLLVRSTIDLAHALEMEVTAEGVDDPLSLSLLRVMGCDQVQGFLVARPMERAALQAWLADTGNYVGMGATVVDLPTSDFRQA